MPGTFLEFLGLAPQSPAKRATVDVVAPARTFAEVILPPATRRTLEQALAQVRNHDLIFREWGLGERHATGLGLAFNFAGPPGTGKTICAEAIAHALGRKLLVVRYAEMESMWAGETPKNVAAVFRYAAEQGYDGDGVSLPIQYRSGSRRPQTGRRDLGVEPSPFEEPASVPRPQRWQPQTGSPAT